MTKPKYLKMTLSSNVKLTFDEKLQALSKASIKVTNYLDTIHKNNQDSIDIKPAIENGSLEIGTLFIKDRNIRTIHTLNKMFNQYNLAFDYTEIDIPKLHILATYLILDVDGSDFDFILDSNRKLNKHKLEYIQTLLNKSTYTHLYEISQYYCKSHNRWHQYIEYIG